MRPARGEYPCQVCGAVLQSPGALGGHMTSNHRRRPDVTRARDRLEHELVKTVDELERAEHVAGKLRTKRDRLVVDLRRLPEPASLREIAVMARLSNPRILQLERAAE